jgi:hypothetical protein
VLLEPGNGGTKLASVDAQSPCQKVRSHDSLNATRPLARLGRTSAGRMPLRASAAIEAEKSSSVCRGRDRTDDIGAWASSGAS